MQMNELFLDTLCLQVGKGGPSDLTKIYGFKSLYSNTASIRKSGAVSCHEAPGDAEEKFADALEYQGAEQIECDLTTLTERGRGQCHL